MSDFKKDESELGALWINTGPRGEYLTGTISGVKVVVFRNDRKEPGSKSPDWRVLKSKPKDDAAAPARYSRDKAEFAKATRGEPDDLDTPF